MQTLLVATHSGIQILPIYDIVRIEAWGNYSKIYLKNTQFPLVLSKALLWCQNQLPSQMFTRVHRSHLLNNAFIKTLSKGEYKTMLLTNGETIAVSRRRGVSAKRQLQQAATQPMHADAINYNRQHVATSFVA